MTEETRYGSSRPRFEAQGDRSPQTFVALRKALGDAQHPAHYLAIPPSMFATVVSGLAAAGSAKGARIIVEKPFGRDLGSARELNRCIHEVFAEDDVFRIDHYLGKEAVQSRTTSASVSVPRSPSPSARA